MSIRLKGKVSINAGEERTEYEDFSFDQRETTVNGYTFHWGPNQIRNFLDEGVGKAHGAFKSGTDACIPDKIPFGSELS